MLTEEQVQTKLAASPAPRVTEEQINARIVNTEYTKIGETVTIATITLDNGFSVRGESACVNAGNYDAAIGKAVAHKDAYRKLWPLFGFLLAESNFIAANVVGEKKAA